jgi:hypothetical protein
MIECKSNEIKVRLRIVGVYFNHEVCIDPTVVTTVKGVMEEYQRLHDNLNDAGGFRFETAFKDVEPHKGLESLFRVIYHYSGRYEFLNGPSYANGATLSGKVRKAGVLRLEEQKLCNTSFENVTVATAWQYYVANAAGISRSATTVNTGFQGYNDNENEYLPFKHGDVITWRLVVLTLPEFEKATTNALGTAADARD